MKNEEPIGITIHGRGGQTAVTGSELLAKFAFEKGFKDVSAIPIIGAERAGAPIQAFARLSRKKQIKICGSVQKPKFILLFDTSLLGIPSIKTSITSEAIILANSPGAIKDNLPDDLLCYYIVDATGICIKRELMHSRGPILNVPMLGAFGRITGYYDLEIMKTILEEELKGKDVTKNLLAAKDAYECVKKVEKDI